MSKPNLLIVGAGGVGAVTAQKAAQFHDEFGTIIVAGRSSGRARAIAEDAQRRWAKPGAPPLITALNVNARDTGAMAGFIRDTASQIVINVATTYCNVPLMDACLEAGAHYIDTSVAEDEHTENLPAPWYESFEWPRRPHFESKGLTALLSIGFDPGVVNVFCAFAKKHLFDRIDSVDIIDVNGGDHGRYFATNFDPETNLREIMEDVIYWEDGAFRTIPHHSKAREVTLPEVGTHKVFSMGHDELHSLPRFLPEAKRIEFWMGFGERYLQVFDVLYRLGLLTSIPVEVEGIRLAPLKMVKAVLPDPSTLAAGYTGKVCIGCDIRGVSKGKERRCFIYSTCDHRACYDEVGSQAISYTTGVPVLTAAMLLARGDWKPGTMVNVEELDPDPFLELMPKVGISWATMDLPLDGSWPSEDG